MLITSCKIILQCFSYCSCSVLLHHAGQTRSLVTTLMIVSLMQNSSCLCDQQRGVHKESVPTGWVSERWDTLRVKQARSRGSDYASQKFLLRVTAELCREFSGWPRRVERSSNKKPCRSRLGNTKTWANMAWGPQKGEVTTSEDGAPFKDLTPGTLP